MRFLQHLLAALSLSLLAVGVGAAPNNPKEGVDYRTLSKPQQTDSGKKVEVTEFFWYACPHCNALEHDLAAWVKKQGDNIVFKRVPVAFPERDSMVLQQKLFYALEAMGKLDEAHQKVFDAVHIEKNRLDTDPKILDFIVKLGIDKQKFLDVYNSFGVQSKVKRAAQLMQAYQITGVPVLAVDGRYVTSPVMARESIGNQPEQVVYQATFQIMDWLVNKAKQTK